MKIYYISDIHLEVGEMKLPGPETPDDILFLAGDICPVRHIDDPHKTAFFTEECAKYRKVYYIMGNHEHYRFVFDNTESAIRDFLVEKKCNVELLTRKSPLVDLNDEYALFGDTLWTDFNKCNTFACLEAKSRMNDYHLITKIMKYPDKMGDTYHKLLPEHTFAEHKRALVALEDALLKTDKNLVVMSHHLPSEASVPKRFSGELVNYAYFSELSEFILNNPRIKFWVHGHTHDSFDYMIGECRVLCNPRGYWMTYDENQEFSPMKYFEI